jgi:hypothetical protein
MTYVYVLFVETNSGHDEDSDGYVHGIFSTYEAADKVRQGLKAQDREDGVDLWPDDDEDDEDADEPLDWQRCYQIRKWQVED